MTATGGGPSAKNIVMASDVLTPTRLNTLPAAHSPAVHVCAAGATR
jgi:hypothetical protein